MARKYSGFAAWHPVGREQESLVPSLAILSSTYCPVMPLSTPFVALAKARPRSWLPANLNTSGMSELRVKSERSEAEKRTAEAGCRDAADLRSARTAGGGCPHVSNARIRRCPKYDPPNFVPRKSSSSCLT